MNNSKIRKSKVKQEDKAPFTLNNVVSLFIFYELGRWSRDLNTFSTLKGSLFQALKLTKNAGPNKYKYNRYSIRFDSRSEFLLSDGSMGKILFLEWIQAHLCILTIRENIF